jgi:mycofactocin precursor
MSERVGTADITEATEPPAAEAEPAGPDLASTDLLVEEVSIDGMCGVY